MPVTNEVISIKVRSLCDSLLVSDGTDLGIWFGIVGRNGFPVGIFLWSPFSYDLLNITDDEKLYYRLLAMVSRSRARSWPTNSMWANNTCIVMEPVEKPHGHMLLQFRNTQHVIRDFGNILRVVPKGFPLFRRYRKRFKELLRELEQVLPSWLILLTLAGRKEDR